jgi:hypothetical protein
MATKSMDWLKQRLKELERTPTQLARHLGIAPPRIYEMVAGRRSVQPSEIGKLAEFLQWKPHELLEHLPDQAIPKDLMEITPQARGMIPVLGTTAVVTTNYDCLLTEAVAYVRATPQFEGRTDIFCIYLQSRTMVPWRDPSELIMYETVRPPKDGDHVVIYLVPVDDTKPVLVRQLLALGEKKARVRRHWPQKKDSDLDLKKVKSMFRVLTWDDAFR